MIKVTFVEDTPKNEKPKYPYYGESVSATRKTIVFFTEPQTGVCVYTNHSCNKEGDFSTEWYEDSFTPITYKLICENVF